MCRCVEVQVCTWMLVEQVSHEGEVELVPPLHHVRGGHERPGGGGWWATGGGGMVKVVGW